MKSLIKAVRDRAARKRPKATIPMLKNGIKPVIDGELVEEAWKRVPELSRFMPLLAWHQKVQMQTRAFICYDREAIYIAFWCEEDRPGGMRMSTARQDDLFLVRDDHVSVLIADPNNPRRVYRFAVSPRSVKHDVACRCNPDPRGSERAPFLLDPRGFNSKWSAAARIQEHAWTAEIRVP